jgi:predicted SAM-dependent methyltransferase
MHVLEEIVTFKEFGKYKLKLNLGAGKDIKKNFVNLDSINLPGINVVHDLEIYPWPFKDNTFDEVYASHVLEHVLSLRDAMDEIKRICKPGARIKIRAPHFSCGVSYRDPTHQRLFSYFTFDYFSKKGFYNLPRFKIISRRLNFTRQSMTFLNYIMNPIINLSPALYERLWCWLIPSAEVIAELEVNK